MIFHARLPGRLPKDDDYRALADVIAKEAQPGDVVLLYPWWTEKARLFMPESVPVLGYLGSDTEDLTDHPRIWLLAQPHLPKSDLSGFLKQFEQGRSRVGDPREFGNLQLSLYRNDRFRPLAFSAAERLAEARVYVDSPNGRIDCQWTGKGHQCPGAGFLRVQREWHEVNQIPRHCLYMHAPGGPARLVAEWQNVPGGTNLALEGGIIWEYAAQQEPEKSDVVVRAEDGNGQQLLGFVAKKGVETFYREHAASPAQPFTLRLSVQADNNASRQMCLDVFARGGNP